MLCFDYRNNNKQKPKEHKNVIDGNLEITDNKAH